MNTLNLGSDEMPEKKKKSNTRNLKIALGLAAVILVPTIGSTLAGQINIGAGSIEFGQGVLTTAACDDQITITPEAVLVDSEFIATQIAVSGINNAACSDAIFTIKMLNATGVAQSMGSGNATLCMFEVAITDPYYIGLDCPATEADEDDRFIFNTSTPVATTDFEKITIESETNYGN
jgi:hypothetical protein